MIEVVVVPRVFTMRIPVVIKRVLVNDDFNRSVTDWTTEVIISLKLDFDFLAETKRFLLAILFGSLYLNFEFRQFVFFERRSSRGPKP